MDLSIIDFEFQRILLDMSLNIEHYVKLKLINALIDEKPGDGIYLVANFRAYNPDIINSIKKQKRTAYNEDMYNKYNDYYGMPIWVFVEFLTFSQLIRFVKYTATYLKRCDLLVLANQLYDIKDIRNACAHDNCILNDLVSKTETGDPSKRLTKALGDIGVSKTTRDRKLTNMRIRQIATVLFMHKIHAISVGLHEHSVLKLQLLKKRFFRDSSYSKNLTISSTFKFFIHLIDSWYHPM